MENLKRERGGGGGVGGGGGERERGNDSHPNTEGLVCPSPSDR